MCLSMDEMGADVEPRAPLTEVVRLTRQRRLDVVDERLGD